MLSEQSSQTKSKLNRDTTAKALLDKLNEVISDLQNGKQVSKSIPRQITTALSKYAGIIQSTLNLEMQKN